MDNQTPIPDGATLFEAHDTSPEQYREDTLTDWVIRQSDKKGNTADARQKRNN
jgi:hypothetical protein